MQFPLNVIVALVISVIHILISFNLKLSNKYKSKFRTYSILVNIFFIMFLIGFSIFFRTSNFNEGIGIYYEGLATFYFLLFVPLLIALIFAFRKLIMNFNTYSKTIKYISLIGPCIVLVGIVVIGYIPFMLSFYGFAP